MRAGIVIGIVVIGIWMVVLSGYDLRERRLPNWLTLPGAVVIVTAACVDGRGTAAVLGAGALFGCYLLVHLLNPNAMGGGDVKLALGLGALTGMFGVDVWVLGSLGAPVLTVGYAVVALLCRRDKTVPHGQSMCLSSAAAVALALV
jgi:leader peptidase (prepilin peptidase)/N-methyltransferase